MNTLAKNLRSLLIAIGLLSLSACVSNIEVTHYPVQQEDHLLELKNYCWDEEGNQDTMGKVSPSGGHHSFFDATVRQRINATLAEKGYHSSSCETANFMIDYRLGIHSDIATADVGAENITDANTEAYVHDYGAKWTFGKQADVHYEGMTKPEEALIIVRHGTLHIAAFTVTGEMLWHSSAEKVLNERNTDAERLETIEKAVEKTMESFPSQL